MEHHSEVRNDYSFGFVDIERDDLLSYLGLFSDSDTSPGNNDSRAQQNPSQQHHMDFAGAADEEEDDHAFNTGRWSTDEHRRFIEALAIHGKNWNAVAEYVQSRSQVQVRTHAQKYYLKIAKTAQGTARVTSSSTSRKAKSRLSQKKTSKRQLSREDEREERNRKIPKTTGSTDQQQVLTPRRNHKILKLQEIRSPSPHASNDSDPFSDGRQKDGVLISPEVYKFLTPACTTDIPASPVSVACFDGIEANGSLRNLLLSAEGLDWSSSPELETPPKTLWDDLGFEWQDAELKELVGNGLYVEESQVFDFFV
mmetsp:Transcript_46791/g.68407  ORF Transcript_46791/g.68407 Transcript_46791/m.68407 type:complete len:311 (-) Transcript_46791:284-1216(-)|eukprot:CAMPEP_0194577906 /NCGR_PEP_ID=MMETSP0292-20121207/12511_1 /TAXON_ID=39354 /ORGANISM="Heterosigma akashiwo, Strain CCMP2393" /LENGTH=310 /DNA_ID=CAMNT_0039430403 /DNA_START=58 /DNA_END=990 /DNA_ORIENTATION=+